MWYLEVCCGLPKSIRSSKFVRLSPIITLCGRGMAAIIHFIFWNVIFIVFIFNSLIHLFTHPRLSFFLSFIHSFKLRTSWNELSSTRLRQLDCNRTWSFVFKSCSLKFRNIGHLKLFHWMLSSSEMFFIVRVSLYRSNLKSWKDWKDIWGLLPFLHWRVFSSETCVWLNWVTWA